ncbi:helix-turn-helix domain-containing protein [Nitratidesulfovibrio vulgaris]|uniref:helix-turn-helix domain-containing protein n=1 Tax=Nitratidesulfovibrio vulgaris TaxID=881 RepID=UPI0001A808B3|nr:helix-turn-helix transcriptional regulator [Nitratidesulfovibrio vulgaris]ADP87628.1 regulatory protein, LacI [Nitratidesulfovibrio vulgaris RCH1]
MPDWLALLHKAVEGRTKAAVARELGVSRPSVSLLLAGRYPGRTDHMAARVLAVYGRIACPHLSADITTAQCRSMSGPVPTSSPAAIRHWRACQACPHRPSTTPSTDGGN